MILQKGGRSCLCLAIPPFYRAHYHPSFGSVQLSQHGGLVERGQPSLSGDNPLLRRNHPSIRCDLLKSSAQHLCKPLSGPAQDSFVALAIMNWNPSVTETDAVHLFKTASIRNRIVANSPENGYSHKSTVVNGRVFFS